MPEFNRVVFEGLIGLGGEIWSCGVNLAPSSGDPVVLPQDLTTWAEAIVAGPIFNLPAALSNGLSSSSRFSGVKTYYYPATTGPAAAVGEAAATKVGSGSLTLPLSTAIVATLRTALSGRRYRGRIYWPAVGFEVDSDGTFDDTIFGPFAENMADFLEGVAAAAAPLADLQPVVVSRAGDVVTTVTSISADNGPDTQRRRDESLTTITATSPYPPP